MTWRGRLFQTRAAATGNARSPTVDNRVRRMNNDGAEWSRVLVVRSAGWRNSSARYDGAIPLRRQRFGNFVGMNWRKGESILGLQKSPSGVRRRRPNRRSSGPTSKLRFILEIDVKLIFYEGKIENAFMSRFFLKRMHAAVLSIHDNRHT